MRRPSERLWNTAPGQCTRGHHDDADGRADIDRFDDFMRGLAPPPTLPQVRLGSNGAKLFASIGCAGCHIQSITTALHLAR